MYENLKKLKIIFEISQIRGVGFFLLLIFFNSFFELVSLGLLIPFAISIVNDDMIEKIYIIFANQNLIDSKYLLATNKKNLYTVLILITIFIFFIKYLINLLFIFFSLKYKVFCEKKIANKILEKIFNSDDYDILNIPKSKIFHDISSKLGTVASSVVNFANLFVELIFLIILSVFLFISSGLLTFYFFLIIIFFYYIFLNFFKKSVQQWSLERGKSGDQRSKSLFDLLEGLREMLIYGVYKPMLNEYNLNNSKYLTPQRKILFWSAVPKICLEASLIIFLLLYFLYEINFKLQDTKALVNFTVVLIIILLRLAPSFNRILYNYGQIKFATESINPILKFLQIRTSQNENTKIKDFSKEILLKNVNFKFDRDKELFKSLNLKIKKNSKVAIIGETGTGKTTLIDIIIGLNNPQNGKIFIDKKDISKASIKHWIKNIAYVSQRVYLFNSSIRNNITFEPDNQKIDDIKFNNIIKTVNLFNFINQKTTKEYFMVGEFGKNVSGGQRQKIGIARALYSNRPIIIFDESTNSLDQKNEKIVIKNLCNLKKKTIIFITHSQNVVQKFDTVYKLKNNRITKIG